MESFLKSNQYAAGLVEKYPVILDYVPTVDRPFFNVSLWTHFDAAVSKATDGKFIPSQFTFVAGELPLSELFPVMGMIGTYYLVIFGGRAVLKNTEPLKLNFLFQLHNLFLTTLSLTLLVLMVEQLVPMIAKHGLYYAICNQGAWTQPMVTLYYMNYITKYIEFIDTIFLVLKHKKLTFLHTYHHGATALLCYTQLVGTTAISWVPISLNLGVHVVMYWYYFLAAGGIRVWWKEWVTRFQIIQFIIDIGFIYFAVWQKVATDYFPTLPHCGECVGSTTATFSGCAIISSYLFLFIAFYIEVYRRQGTKKSKVIKRVKGGVAAKVNEYVNVDVKNVNTPSPSPAPRKRNTRSRKA
ncbi:Fatty acyl-CoA elongase/Polyunsaturated fatty acid specific elongation enzyme [Kluyveromyces marxianus]|nr:Fatty acyl-CoA elongase/Polyunsaturated fatty acid specific elongation enzyme [Kluyveromyces marxianus]KAG0682637.1 Fatty acyl-CoA elongase/Polyunsaturated fatty acid specific elongation enzyme [Kluyveromyces marxianus]